MKTPISVLRFSVLVAGAVAMAGCTNPLPSSAPSSGGAPTSSSVAAAPTTTSATPSTTPDQAVEASVVRAVQRKLDTDTKYSSSHLKVRKATIVHSHGNDYKGDVYVDTVDGTEHQVPVTVTDDGTHVLVHTEPGAWAWINGSPAQSPTGTPTQTPGGSPTPTTSGSSTPTT